jgi:ubiquinone/menaquinone biosynthesis C-methylase UbiE
MPMIGNGIARAVRVALKRLAFGGGASRRDRDRVVNWLELRPGMKIADVGAGFGAFAFEFARAVGHSGIVYTVDTDPDLRAEVARSAGRLGLDQIRPIEAHQDDSGIPEPVDLVFLSASFHHLPDRVRYFERLRDRLRPNGVVAILEARPGFFLRLPGHATPPAEVRATLEAAGYRLRASAELVAGASLQAFGLPN